MPENISQPSRSANSARRAGLRAAGYSERTALGKFETIQDLYDRRKSLWEANEDLLNAAESETRDFNATEKETWEKRDAEIVDLTSRIERLHQLHADTFDGRWIDDKCRPTADRREHTGSAFAPCDSLSRAAGDSPHFSVARCLEAAYRKDARFLGECEQRALGEGTDTLGGFLTSPTFNRALIDLARSKSVAIAAGAQTVQMDSSEMIFARLDSDPTVSWAGESETLTATDAQFGRITLTARTARFFIPISMELAADATNLGSILADVTAKALALALDQAILFGGTAGNGIEPVGIVNTAGVQTIAAVGSPADFSPFSNAVELCRTANVTNPLTLIAHPRTFSSLDKLQDTTGQPMSGPDSWNALAKFPTTSMSIVEGAGSNESSAVIGDFSQAVVGMRTNATLLEGPVTTSDFAKSFVGFLRADVAVTHPDNFVVLSGILA